MPKIDKSKIRLEALSERSNVKDFDCRDQDLNDFLINDALPHQEDGLAQITLCYYDKELVGFFSLSCDAIKLKPSERKVKPRYLRYLSSPALKIGRMGIKKEYQQQGFGRLFVSLVVGLANRLNKMSIIGCRFITVDAYSRSVDFYKKLGFEFNLHQEYKEKTNPSMRLDIYKYRFS